MWPRSVPPWASPAAPTASGPDAAIQLPVPSSRPPASPHLKPLEVNDRGAKLVTSVRLRYQRGRIRFHAWEA